MGAAGALTGSVWLTTEEGDCAVHRTPKFLAAGSRDTIRSAGRTGKPSRQLVSDWTDAWKAPTRVKTPLPLLLQSMLVEPVLRPVDKPCVHRHGAPRRWRPTSSARAWA